MCNISGFSWLTIVPIMVINLNLALTLNPLRSVIKLTDMRCTATAPHLMSFEECRIERQANATKAMTLCRIYEPLKQIRLRLRGYRKRNIGYVPFVVDINLDWCAFLKNRNNEVLQRMFSVFENYSNLNTGCPVTIDYTYMNMTLKRDGGFNIPFKWPPGDYRLDITIDANKAIRLIINCYFKVDW